MDICFFPDDVMERLRHDTKMPDDVANDGGGTVPTFEESKTVWVTSKGDLHNLKHHIQCSRWAVLDLETTGLCEYASLDDPEGEGIPAAVTMMTLTLTKQGGDEMIPINYIIPLKHPESPFLGHWRTVLKYVCQRLMRNPRLKIAGHNIKFDLRWIYASVGMELAPKTEWDTQVVGHLLDENSSSALKQLAPRMFGCEAWDDFDLSEEGASIRVPLTQLGDYAARDTYWTWRVLMMQRHMLHPLPKEEIFTDEDAELQRLGTLVRECVVPALKTLAEVEIRGIWLDDEYVHEEMDRLAALEEVTYDALTARFPDMHDDPELEGTLVSFAPTSNYFKAWVDRAVDEGSMEIVEMTKAGRASWSAKVLTKLAARGSEPADQLLQYRDANKKGQFLKAWLSSRSPDGNIHANYNLGRTVTGRLSSSNPNMQQVDRQLKRCFGPKPGYVLAELDYSQIELRVAGFIAKCEPMIRAFNEGQDLHRMIAAVVAHKDVKDVTKEERQRGKACIAQGSLVLTDKGEVPIEKVTLGHKVWDGHEWVSHGGVIFQGVRPVITKDGLTATPDHKVYIDDTHSEEWIHAKENRRRIRIVGTGETEPPVRSNWTSVSGRVTHQVPGEVHEVRQASGQAALTHAAGSEPDVQVRGQEVQDPRRDSTSETLRSSAQPVPEREPRSPGLRESGHRDEDAASRVGDVGAGEPASPDLPQDHGGEDQLERALRTWELTTQGSRYQYETVEYRAPMPGQASALPWDSSSPRTPVAPSEVRLPSPGVQLPDSSEATVGGSVTGTDCDAGTEGLAPVYDILNCGLRHRFTVSGHLVSNCNFGFLFGMREETFIEYAEVSYGVKVTEDEAIKVRRAFFDTWDGLEQWHQRARKTVRRRKQVVSPLGRVRRLEPLLARGEYSDADRVAVNAPVQGMASDIMQMAAARIAGNARGFGAIEGARIVGTVHDSILVEMPEDRWQEVSAQCVEAMETDVLTIMRRMGCDFSVPLVADCEVGTRWSLTDVSG